MKTKRLNKLYNVIFSVLALLAMWIIWIVAYNLEGNDYVIPSFTSTIIEFFRLLVTSSFWTSFGNTFLRSILAFVCSFVLAAILCFLSCLSKKVQAFLKPFVTVLRTIPTMAIILILLLWTSHTTAPVIVGALVTFPMLYAQFMAAYKDVDTGLFDVSKAFNVSKKDRVFKMYLPLMCPNIFSQAGPAFSLTLKVIVSAEVMANTYKSIGGMLQQSKIYLEIPELFALTLVTIAVGAVAELLFSLLKLTYRKWKRGES